MIPTFTEKVAKIKRKHALYSPSLPKATRTNDIKYMPVALGIVSAAQILKQLHHSSTPLHRQSNNDSTQLHKSKSMIKV